MRTNVFETEQFIKEVLAEALPTVANFVCKSSPEITSVFENNSSLFDAVVFTTTLSSQLDLQST
ncbi:MAG: hypothetical protein MJA27_15915 [Pseudanabaenales cyanobacterium]|nr:hypothetical protein [Pseudanabaenales cyanobacterium]